MNRTSIIIGSILLALALLFFVIDWYALIPACIVLGLAIMTQKAMEPLIVGCSVGFLMIPIYGDPQIAKEVFGYGAEHGLGFPLNMLAALEDTIARDAHNYGLMWVILVCMLYGAFVQLLVSSGGINKLAKTSEKFVKTKRDSLIMTFVLSVVFFIDDYLNALTVGNTMRPITDKFKISREKLAMIMSLVCVPITIIIPISTWTIFYGAQLMTIDSVAAEFSNPINAFANTIIYNFSAWISLIVAVLVIWKVIPDFKGIKDAEQKMANLNYSDEQEVGAKINNKKPKLWYFFIPLAVLMIFSVLPYPTEWSVELLSVKGFTANVDALRGVATAVVITYLLFLISGAVSFHSLSLNFIKGLESMTFVLVLLGFTYMLKEVQDVLGFNTFVSNKLGDLLNPQLLPAIIFLVVAVISWATASSWGIYAILVPLTAILCLNTGANFWLVQGALASGSVWGTAACFFADNRVLIAQATKTNMIVHSITQLPYQMIILVVSTILYLIVGYFI